ncbi:DUF397 domain-containing protein [Streptomyces griseoviridis]|uniref:Toxin n=1 Tax=Streptomyces griseoviridis TaxID=45398 RepID=A0A918GQJ4_STRGD|nr:MULTISPECIES: DUF397 domain-containing protein [Streptomyces]GGS52990.1 toxin [Streptomyces niveoruber]
MSGTALEWFKSSYSGSEGGQCLEVAHVWCKSSHSGDEGGNCVEVAHERSVIHIRDSKTPTTPHLTVTPEAWTAFLRLAH